MTQSKAQTETTYKISFIGRQAGAIGKRYRITETVKAANQEAAELKLYDKYEHIAVLDCKPLRTENISVLSYCDYSDTIRQFPENYLIAHRNTTDKTWVCDPDLAADKGLATRVFLELFNFESKYAKTGLELLAKVTPNK